MYLREKVELIGANIAAACVAGHSKLVAVHLSENHATDSSKRYVMQKLAVSDHFDIKEPTITQIQPPNLETKQSEVMQMQNIIHEFFRHEKFDNNPDTAWCKSVLK